VGTYEYEALLARHEPLQRLAVPQDEMGRHRRVLHFRHHRQSQGRGDAPPRAYLNAVSNAATWSMPQFPKYLWTCRCSTATAGASRGGGDARRHTGVSAQVESRAIFDAMRAHAVDHYCAAPIVHNLLINAEAALRDGLTQRVRGMVAGAAPPGGDDRRAWRGSVFELTTRTG